MKILRNTFYVLLIAAFMLAACGGGANNGDNNMNNNMNNNMDNNDGGEDMDDSGLPDLGGREVTIAVENAYLPFNYISLDTGEAAGWDYDVWDELCERLNCVPVYVEAVWDGMIQAVADGQFDVAADGITITEERDEIVDFSIGYVAIEQRLLVRLDEDRFSNMDEFVADESLVMGTQTGTTNYETASDYLSDDRLQAFETFPFAVQSLIAGDIDAVIIDEVAGQGYMGENADDLKLVGDSLSSDFLGFAFPEGSDLVAAVDAGLQSMIDDGTLAAINTEYFGPGFVITYDDIGDGAYGGGDDGGEGGLFCQVTDVGGIDDKSFNATVWQGFEAAAADFGVDIQFLESQQQTDYEVNINAFIDEGCDLIVSVGFLLGDATYAAADANTDQPFGIVDYPNSDPAKDNLVGMLFATDQAAFLAGYIAAATTETGTVATFGGIQIPCAVTCFMDGFWYGVEYYNQENGADVRVLGWDPATQEGLFTGNFESTDDGRSFGENLMDEGADVIMPVAGPVGLGTAAAIQARGNAWLIGVDTDWTVSAPEYADVTLTSVLKNMNNAVYDLIASVLDGTFPTGANYFGTLENDGVGVATDGLDADLIAKLEELAKMIIAGEIQTAP